MAAPLEDFESEISDRTCVGCAHEQWAAAVESDQARQGVWRVHVGTAVQVYHALQL